VALFNRRNRNQTNVPTEIQEYYQTERRERAGVAWLLAGGTLVATVLLAAAIFFAGRWVYRTAFDNDDPKTTEVAQQDKKEEERPATQGGQGQSTPQPQPTPSPTPTTPAPTPTTPTPAPAPAAPAPTPQPNPAPAPQPTPQPQPTTGGTTAGTNTALATTGPADTLGLFVAVTAFGYLLHRLLLRQSARRG